MRIATFLPHVGVFGGVRRYLELGNAWTAEGHEVTLFHPDGGAPTWLPYSGVTRRLAEAATTESDVALCGDPHTYSAFRAHHARAHIYYCVLERDPGLPAAIADRTMRIAANSGPLRRHLERRTGRRILDGIGGIDPLRFHPSSEPRPVAPIRIMANGRRSRPKKGTDLVLAALRSLARSHSFETVLFDALDPKRPQDPRPGARTPPGTRWVLDPTQSELVELYQSSHIFVAAERKAGWCNTALEAMASGCAVVCTRSGTTDFARDRQTALVVPLRHPWFLERAIARLLEDAALRERLSQAGPTAAQPWSWPALARRLLEQVAADAGLRRA
jgi:glycosyltransferase involved in cell wall biosynthesis